MLFKIGILKKILIFTGILVLESLFNKVKETPTHYFPVNIAEFIRTTFYRTPIVNASENWDRKKTVDLS